MKKLLVVDDDHVNRAVVVDVLMEEWQDCEVLTAPDGKIGLEIARNELPEIILLDWEMPVMNGLEMLKELRRDSDTNAIPVIMYTGIRTDSNNLKMALEAGANEFLRKPMDHMELVARIRSISLQVQFFKERNRAESEKQRMELELRERELALKTNELVSLAFILEQKDLFIKELLEDAEELQHSSDLATRKAKAGKLIRKLKFERNSEVSWDTIKVRMNDIHSGFLARLLERHPDLTKSELKLCSLMKLNLSRKETANILHISVSGVEKRRYRLRKKLGLDQDIKMDNYINTFSSPVAVT